MKKIILFGFCLVLASHIAYAQSWQWSKKITQSEFYNHFGYSKGLETDKNGNVYSYGANYSTSTDTIGSYLQCYSTNGVLLFSKQWKIPFHIQKMDYDGNDYFYFAGKFYGTQTIDGITIISQGNEDGVIGKMDLLGNIIWMKTFGGGGLDGAFGICLIPGDSGIYITGGIKDTLFFNNYFESVNQQSAIICQYSAEGQLLRHKLYDFIPQRDIEYRNCGVEIAYNKTGNIYMLMDRDGVQWYGDTINSSY